MARTPKTTKNNVSAEEVQESLQTALDAVEEKLQAKVDTFAEDHKGLIDNLNSHKTTHYILHIITFAIAAAAHIL